MVAGKKSRLREVAKEFNVGTGTIVEFLEKKGIHIENNPNSRIEEDTYVVLFKEYATDINLKKESEKLNIQKNQNKPKAVTIDQVGENKADDEEEIRITDYTSSPNNDRKTVKKEPEKAPEIKNEIKNEIKIVGKIDLDKKPKKIATETEKPKDVSVTEKPKELDASQKPLENKQPHEHKVTHKPKETKEIQTEIPKTDNLKIVGKIDLEQSKQKTTHETRETREHHQKPTHKPQQQDTKAPQHDTKTNPKTHNQLQGQSQGQAKSHNHQKAEVKPKREDKITADVKPKIDALPIPEKVADETVVKTDRDNIFAPSPAKRLVGPTVVGKIELPEERKKKATPPKVEETEQKRKKKRRKRIKKEKPDGTPATGTTPATPVVAGTTPPTLSRPREAANPHDPRRKPQFAKKRAPVKVVVSEDDVAKQIKDTLLRLTTKAKSKTSKYRRDKRDAAFQKHTQDSEEQELTKNVLKVTEFVSVSDLATMMGIAVNEIISTCMNMGLFVSINQRLDAETMAMVVDEFGFKIEFVSAEVLDAIHDDAVDTAEELVTRPPIVTVMGHVDHGKTSLLDYVRKTNVIAGEAGGITQHIGAYSVVLNNGRTITFLDTPGHEAFTAMRARGAQVTDVVIIVVAADDNIMPQTREAINHAQAAGVPIIFAINKIDKENARPEKIKEALANMNILIEEWGGKFQSQDISAKNGLNIEELLDKVLLESDVLDLKANPNRRAAGTIIESQLDKGRGYVATVLVQNGTLNIGDIVLAGTCYGHIKAMYNERGQRVKSAGPATPIQILGLNGAPQAGDKFNVMPSDKEAKDISMKRDHLAREQSLRTQKHITLDEIGRRIAIGSFQELNLIIKGDVDGSIEALSDSLLKLSTPEIQVNVIHKAVGQISESDVLLAAASNAIIIGFQVRPSMSARKLAEQEEIDIRLYSIIYNAINEIHDAMEGMLSPDMKEQIVGTAEVLDVFKITKVGTIGGCIVREGKIKRINKVRVIRDGIVVYTGELGSLKRFKDDAKEVLNGFECGMNVDKFNDIKAGDFIESFEMIEVRKKL